MAAEHDNQPTMAREKLQHIDYWHPLQNNGITWQYIHILPLINSSIDYCYCVRGVHWPLLIGVWG